MYWPFAFDAAVNMVEVVTNEVVTGKVSRTTIIINHIVPLQTAFDELNDGQTS